jgi:hypothetical protein
MRKIAKSFFQVLGMCFFVAVIACVVSAADFAGTYMDNPGFNSSQPALIHHVGQSVKNDLSAPLRLMAPVQTLKQPGIKEIPLFSKPPSAFKKEGPDLLAQIFFTLSDQGFNLPFMNIPSTLQNFEGVNNVNGVIPPDSNGDVGLNHYVQWVNLSFAVYDKSGTLLYGPVAGKTLWSGFGGPCQTDNDGDPIVLYDRQADRWMMSQFALPNYPSGPFYQCIAVSQTGDPMGSWYRYAFTVSATKLNDYAKFGIWPDGYYMSVNQFDATNSFSYAGVAVVAFERSKMLQGLAAQSIMFDLFSTDSDLFGLLPSHLNGPDAPPSGSSNYFAAFDDDSDGYPFDALEIWGFHVDWTTPANSSFSKLTTLPTASFNSNLCNYARNCIPQRDTAIKVDAISTSLMNRLQYRNFGSYATLVANHTINIGDSTNHAGIRWYELVNSGGGWTIMQQGSYSPDSDNRWMGSLAMDGMGNIALGYSVSSSITYPSIRYTGRIQTDPIGVLAQGEYTIIAGGGSQTSTSYRWGDYSSMSVDPTDDSTFWYTQEYYSATSSFGWQTRIAAISLCSNNHARTTVSPVYWATLGTAYANAASTDTIAAQSVTFRENLNLDQGKTITLRGGYDCTYSANALKSTIIGSLTVSTGSVVIDSIAIQ